MKEGLKIAIDFFLDCVFPHSCFVCGASDVYFCGACRTSEWFANPPGIFDPPENSSLACSASLTRYTPGAGAGRLIEDLKYSFIKESDFEIKRWLGNAQWISEFFLAADLIVPVPLHRRRYAERGYNQADIIARHLSGILGKPVNISVLVRVKATKQQAKLNRAERLVNTKSAFACLAKDKIQHKKIILVDDVYTTGSTIGECAETLLKHGAESVSGFTLARG